MCAGNHKSYKGHGSAPSSPEVMQNCMAVPPCRQQSDWRHRFCASKFFQHWPDSMLPDQAVRLRGFRGRMSLEETWVLGESSPSVLRSNERGLESMIYPFFGGQLWAGYKIRLMLRFLLFTIRAEILLILLIHWNARAMQAVELTAEMPALAQ